MARSEKRGSKSIKILAITIVDTTWRMFVPSITGVLGGFWLDQKLDTLPWLFIIGTVMGCLLAGILVVRQLKRL